ncbi:MAG TPA: DUF3108 domain-containing protein [Xanthobacteraceae bacterium]|nr:DUF3108 domain-containing protein [Xanthobacteraceae bacterium]
MLPIRLDLPRLLQASAAALTVLACAAPAAAYAQAKLDARYTASLGGVTIGRGAWVIDFRDDQYTAAASGMATGLLKMFAGGTGTSASRGNVANGQPVPRSYAATITANKKKDEIEITIENGAVKDYTVKPPSPPDPERVPITEAHRRGVTDPMTASLVRAAGGADPMTPETCQRSSAVFDGRMRYDLRLAFKRMEKVKAEKGYQGPVVVCSVSFAPLAGHIPSRAVIKYLTSMQDSEVWLAPVAGTRIVVPFRISVPTPVGDAVLEATQFVVTPAPRVTPTNAKAL